MPDLYRIKNRARINARRRARYAKNSARELAANRAYRKHQSEELKRRRRIRVYGIDGAALWQAQGGRCAICRNAMLRRGSHARAAHLDHDHETKSVRGWLCSTCNVGLGHFRDDPMLLCAAQAYLAKHG